MNVIIDQLPAGLEEFLAMKQMDLTAPENTCAMFLCALHLFIQNAEEGIEAMNALKGPAPLSSHDIQFLKDRVMDKPYLAQMYFEGATPDNNYEPDRPLTLKLYDDGRPQDVEEGYLRLYLQTAGADSKRAIKLRAKGDEWLVWEYPGILLDVRKPKQEDPWA